MSRGPGRIERAIDAAFAAEPDGAFTVERLAGMAYPEAGRIERRHRVAVLRAARNVLERRPEWRMERSRAEGGIAALYRADSARSIALKDLIFGQTWCCPYPLPYDALVASLAEGGSNTRRLDPGSWARREAAIARARLDGREAEADRLQAEHDEERRRKMAEIAAQVRAAWGR